MSKCTQCLAVAAECNGKTPVGQSPFAWGPLSEDPQHFYVFPETVGDAEGQVDVTPLCEIDSPVPRGG